LGATNFDAVSALAAMDKNAGQFGTSSDGNAVRSLLNDFTILGYLEGSASVTLEYASADFALAHSPKRWGTRTNMPSIWLTREIGEIYLMPPLVTFSLAILMDLGRHVTPSSETGFTEGVARNIPGWSRST